MKTISKLKKELDKWFSLYIRLRDADSLGFVQCFTCQRFKHYKSGMQNGHFQSRSFLSTRCDEENCQPRCVGCNMVKSGEQYKFSVNLDNKYGEGKAKQLEFEARQIQKFSRVDYEENISYYKLLVEKLKTEKGIE